MKTRLSLLAALSAAVSLSPRALAQSPTAGVPVSSAAASGNVVAYLGARIPHEKGPWILGEVLFFSTGRLVSDSSWRAAVRGTHGSLYTNADIDSDIERLMALKKFDKVDADLYEIPGTPVPHEFEGVTASTAQVRLVFTVVEKVVAESTTKPKAIPTPAAVSGVTLTPTAYRGAGRYAAPGLGLDINAAYYIGRLYGKNNFAKTPSQTNYLDRLGVWLLTADGKMQVQSETALRPAVAGGVQATALLRDSPQPSVTENNTITVKASNSNAQILTDAYFVASKKFGPVRTSVGVMEGTIGNLAANLSEFLTPEAIQFYRNGGASGTTVTSHTVPFASFLALPRPEYPLGFEIMKFNGAALNPWLINFKVGYFLKLNFDLAYLKYQGGYDVLGLIQFRYNYFPRH